MNRDILERSFPDALIRSRRVPFVQRTGLQEQAGSLVGCSRLSR